MITVYVVKDLDSGNFYTISAHDRHRIDERIQRLGDDREVGSTYKWYDHGTDVDWDTMICAKIQLGKDGMIVEYDRLEEDLKMITQHLFIPELSSDAVKFWLAWEKDNADWGYLEEGDEGFIDEE